MIGWKPKSRDSAIASVRYRCLIPLATLSDAGHNIELFEQQNIHLYKAVIFSKLYDQKNLEIAKQLKKQNSLVILDICDNHLYNPYRLPQYEAVRKNLLEMLSLSDIVICASDALADFLFNEVKLEKRPLVIGDAVEELPPAGDIDVGGYLRPWYRRLFSKPAHSRNNTTQLLWFGSHGSPNAESGMLDILNIADLLKTLSGKYDFQLNVVSNNVKKYQEHIAPLSFQSRYSEWTFETFASELRSADAVIIPITQNPFSICKTNNRLAMALNYQTPVIADGIPSYMEFSPFAFIDRWEEGLTSVLNRAPEVEAMTQKGKGYIDEHWVLPTVVGQWRALIGVIEQKISHLPSNAASVNR